MADLADQIKIEEVMYYGGIKRAEAMMTKAEEAGNAHQNPYAKSIFNDFVLPVAEAIRYEVNPERTGPRYAHAKLLAGIDPDAVAFLAVRTTMNALLTTAERTHRTIAYAIGKTIHSELVLAQIELAQPELYHTLANDLGRRLSKDARHRMTVMKMQAAKAGVEVIEWPVGARDQVGLYLLGLMEVAGMIEIAPPLPVKTRPGRAPKTGYKPVFLAAGVMDQINDQKAYTAISMPVYGPCVIPPRPWATPTDGGFYTRELIRGHRHLVHATASSRQTYAEASMPTVLEAVNALQNTRWQVNARILDVVLKTAEDTRGTKEIVSMKAEPKPEAPSWLTKDMDKTTMTPEQTLAFKAWKRQMAEWHTQRKLLGTRYGRFYSATRAAEMFRNSPEIFFVYFLDSRGRAYPMTYGLNPQGSDLQRSMLQFAEGLPVDTPDAIRWFHVQGANKWGFDKATLEERQAWVVERQDQIVAMATDPLNNDGWKKADKPLQFLAWAFEYTEWLADTSSSFLSHLPISMDGSCNGLQNLSALLRDEIGGEATNLTANEKMQDIYQRVADAAFLRLQQMEDDEAGIRVRWLRHGISRKAVKRSVMTTPYGVTKSSAEEYVVTDYLFDLKDNPFTSAEYTRAAKVLMQAVWPAIGDVVVKGREAMGWLKKSAHSIVNKLPADAEPLIHWTSPSGFPATQAYFKADEHRINTRLHGSVKIVVASESEDPDVYKHASGLAPNFVHSMDAAHLHRTTSQCARRGIDALAMIHDDYGTHAANAQTLYEIIREQFVAMYEEHDPIAEFKARYPDTPKAPLPGSLDIKEVLRSKYFFS